MEEKRFMYYGQISDCKYKDFFQIIFDDENFEIAKKIITDSESLYKKTKIYESDYFIKDPDKQKINSCLDEDKDIDEHDIEYSNDSSEYNENNFESEISEIYKGMESNYSDEPSHLDTNNPLVIKHYLMIDTSLFSEKSDFVYINLKMSTIVLVVLLLDAKMPIGWASAILGAIGINTTLITKLKEENGEICILLEICSKAGRKAPLDFFDKFIDKECVNNHFECKYRRDGKCSITKDEIKKVCNYFISRNIIKQQENEYMYNI